MNYNLIGYNVYRRNGAREFYPKDQFTMIYWDSVSYYREVYERLDNELPAYQVQYPIPCELLEQRVH